MTTGEAFQTGFRLGLAGRLGSQSTNREIARCCPSVPDDKFDALVNGIIDGERRDYWRADKR
jgi:hypothetical protein